MTMNKGDNNRDAVLIAFHEACDRPTAADIIEWIGRYPQFADDIRDHAALMRECGGEEIGELSEEEMTILNNGRSYALQLLHKAKAKAEPEAGAAPAAAAPPATFDQILKHQGLDIPALASLFGIPRAVLSLLINGRMLPPIGARLVQAFGDQFSITYQQFDGALDYALRNPKLGQLKAQTSAQVTRQSYEDVIRDSDMSEERKAYWLSEN